MTYVLTWFSACSRRSSLVMIRMLAMALCVAGSRLPSWKRASSHGRKSFSLRVG